MQLQTKNSIRRNIIGPQPGPQTMFLSTSADICIYGGEAGGGKSFGLLLEPLRHINNKRFGSLCFRRESGQITNEGGLWDTARELYTPFVKNPDRDFVASPKHTVRFKSGAKHTFSHLQLERHVLQWDGSQIPLIEWDELQHFTAYQWWYMFSRNRSTCGVKPYMRATCMPDPDSFLLEFLKWYINQETGYPIDERSGVLRYFFRDEGQIVWGNSYEELHDKYPSALVKSFTFIRATLDDNQELLKKDPSYKANIAALLPYERKRLGGNWFARPTAGELFKYEYFTIREEVPEMRFTTRYWDRAATEPNEKNPDPDYTAGVKLGIDYHDRVWILDVIRGRWSPGDVDSTVKRASLADTRECIPGLEQEPGASGKAEVASYAEWFDDNYFDYYIVPKTKNKLTCWKPAARYARNQGFMIVKAPWNKDFLTELTGLTDGTQSGHDDQGDGFAGAYTRCEQEIISGGGVHASPDLL